MDLSFLGRMFQGKQVEQMIAGMVQTALLEPGKAEQLVADLLALVGGAFPEQAPARARLFNAAAELAQLAADAKGASSSAAS